MKEIASALLGLALLTVSSARAPGNEKEKELPPELSSAYYPLRIGNTWQCKVGDTVVTTKVAKHEKVGDKMCALIETSLDTRLVATEHISSGPEGIFRHTFNGARFSEPLCILKLP